MFGPCSAIFDELILPLINDFCTSEKSKRIQVIIFICEKMFLFSYEFSKHFFIIKFLNKSFKEGYSIKLLSTPKSLLTLKALTVVEQPGLFL